MKCTERAIRWFESNHMKSNTSKFQAMIMTPCPSTEPIMVDINGQNVQPSDCVKLLGAMLMINCNFRTTFILFVHEHRGKFMLSTGYQNFPAKIARLNLQRFYNIKLCELFHSLAFLFQPLHV